MHEAQRGWVGRWLRVAASLVAVGVFALFLFSRLANNVDLAIELENLSYFIQ